MGLLIIPADNILKTESFGRVAYDGIRISLTCIVDIHASRHISGHDVASGFIEHRLSYTGVSGTERFPVSERRVTQGIETISYQT